MDLLTDGQVFEGKIVENPTTVEAHPTSIHFENNSGLTSQDAKEREEIFYEDLPDETVDKLVNALMEENKDEINATLTSLQNEPYVERRRVEITQKVS